MILKAASGSVSLFGMLDEVVSSHLYNGSVSAFTCEWVQVEQLEYGFSPALIRKTISESCFILFLSLEGLDVLSFVVFL